MLLTLIIIVGYWILKISNKLEQSFIKIEFEGEFSPSDLLISYSNVEDGENGIFTNDNGVRGNA